MPGNEVSAPRRGSAGDPAEAVRPVQRRKHGEELRAAIHGAVLDELRERGFTALTMDAVATRAQTGKATLYRYWPSKIELVVDAVLSSMSRIEVPEDDGDLRGQLLAVLRTTADDMAGPTGMAARSLIAELVRNPELTQAIGPAPPDPAIVPIQEVLRRAALRGEVPAAALHPRVAGVGPDLLRSYAVLNQLPIPEAVLVEIVDLVLLPLLRGYPNG
ncbi:MAG TPA: TetR/AcrR family transcriptional regulator [Pseudonocardia sp.]|nr:TetR/AcrR family transcriptional regulator [Pseudonocardia sp.]